MRRWNKTSRSGIPFRYHSVGLVFVVNENCRPDCFLFGLGVMTGTAEKIKSLMYGNPRKRVVPLKLIGDLPMRKRVRRVKKCKV
jgi:hypothetical protein